MKFAILIAAMMMGSVALADSCAQPEGVICLEGQGSVYLRFTSDENTINWGTETLKRNSSGAFKDSKGNSVDIELSFDSSKIPPMVILNGKTLTPCAEVCK